MPQFIKMGNQSTGYMTGHGSALRSKRKRAARRRIHPGFPWGGSFKTMEEVKEYLSHDRITCLLCGRVFKRLGLHTMQIHGIDIDKYKIRFGIPWGESLACEKTRENYSRSITDHPERMKRVRELAESVRGTNKRTKKGRPLCAAVINLQTQKVRGKGRQFR